MARIKNFFGASASSIEAQKTEAEKIEDSNRDKNRNNRNRNNRNRNERNKNAPQERPNRNNEAKPQEPRQQKPQQARGEQTRNDKPRNNQQANAIQTTVSDVTTGAELAIIETGTEQTTERSSSSRRNRNNRRGRRDRVENNAGDANRPFIPNDEIATSQPSANADTEAVQPKAAEQVAAYISSIAEPASSETPKAKADNRRQKAPKTSAAKANVASSSANEVVQPTASEVVEPSGIPAAKADNKRPARPRKAKTEAKPVDLAAVGLQLVETKADAPKVVAPVEAEKPRAPRKAASWQKNAKDEANAEPMVMVETQGK
jgi:ribonuclease E